MKSLFKKKEDQGNMNKLKEKLLVIISITCILSLIGVGVLAAQLMNKNKEPKVTASSISQRLTALSELATSQLEYRGIIRYEEGDITFINKKSYTMLYDAKIKAGIDLSTAVINIKGDVVEVTLPEAKILDININPDTLEFYDEKNSLFNWDNKQDAVTALQLAHEDADKKIDQVELLNTASSQAKLVIQHILLPAVGSKGESYEIVFK